jgi:hypothetical protein
MTDLNESTRRRLGPCRRATVSARTRMLFGAMALGLATLSVSGCGSGAASGAASSAAQKAGQAVSTAAAHVDGVAASATGEPAADTTATRTTATSSKSGSATPSTRTKTLTKTAPAKTRTETKSVAGPTASISVHNSKSVKAGAVKGTPTTTDSSGGGLPWWAWVLIGMGVVGALVAVFTAGRHRGKTTSSASESAAPETPPPSTPGPPPPPDSNPPAPPPTP